MLSLFANLGVFYGGGFVILNPKPYRGFRVWFVG